MYRDPVVLIDQSIENLATLAELFADESGERLAIAPPLSSRARMCKEAAQTIRVLLPKLQAARAQHSFATQPRIGCVNCED